MVVRRWTKGIPMQTVSFISHHMRDVRMLGGSETHLSRASVLGSIDCPEACQEAPEGEPQKGGHIGAGGHMT